MMPSEHNQSSSGHSRKTVTSVATLKPPEYALKCPRCDSSNTKFCYYNNYSLTQPRHFCKTCRRYWTRGGALRNVPIGGGCRKNKKSTSSNTTKSSSIRGYSSDYSIHDSASSENGLKFFQHHAPSTMDFQLGGLSLSRLHHSSSTTGVYNQFAAAAAANTSYGDMSHHTFPGSFSNSSSVLTNGGGGVQISGAKMASSLNIHSNLASSIESLSCINQDLHWKLQQQRLGMLFGTGDHQMKEINNMNDLNESHHHHQKQKPLQPILFQNLEITKPDDEVTVAISKSGTADSIVVGGNGNHNNNNINTCEWFLAENTNYPPNTYNNNNSSQANGVQTWIGLNHHHQQHHVQFTDQ